MAGFFFKTCKSYLLIVKIQNLYSKRGYKFENRGINE